MDGHVAAGHRARQLFGAACGTAIGKIQIDSVGLDRALLGVDPCVLLDFAARLRLPVGKQFSANMTQMHCGICRGPWRTLRSWPGGLARSLPRLVSRLRVPRRLRKNPAYLALHSQDMRGAIQLDRVSFDHGLPLPQSSLSRVHRMPSRRVRDEVFRRNVRGLWREIQIACR